MPMFHYDEMQNPNGAVAALGGLGAAFVNAATKRRQMEQQLRDQQREDEFRKAGLAAQAERWSAADRHNQAMEQIQRDQMDMNRQRYADENSRHWAESLGRGAAKVGDWMFGKGSGSTRSPEQNAADAARANYYDRMASLAAARAGQVGEPKVGTREQAFRVYDTLQRRLVEEAKLAHKNHTDRAKQAATASEGGVPFVAPQFDVTLANMRKAKGLDVPFEQWYAGWAKTPAMLRAPSGEAPSAPPGEAPPGMQWVYTPDEPEASGPPEDQEPLDSPYEREQ